MNNIIESISLIQDYIVDIMLEDYERDMRAISFCICLSSDDIEEELYIW